MPLGSRRRRRWILAGDDRRPLAELAEDRVTAHTMGRGTEAIHWRELEVELTEHGSPELLDRIEKQLLKAGAQRSGSDNKLSRALADRLPANEAEHDAGSPGSAAAAVLSYLRTHADTFRRYDPLVRRDAPDSVHKMRVSSRRMRSTLQAYRRVLDRDARAPALPRTARHRRGTARGGKARIATSTPAFGCCSEPTIASSSARTTSAIRRNIVIAEDGTIRVEYR